MSSMTVAIILYSMQHNQNQHDIMQKSLEEHFRYSEIRFSNDEKRVSEIARDLHQRIGNLEQIIVQGVKILKKEKDTDGILNKNEGQHDEQSKKP